MFPFLALVLFFCSATNTQPVISILNFNASQPVVDLSDGQARPLGNTSAALLASTTKWWWVDVLTQTFDTLKATRNLRVSDFDYDLDVVQATSLASLAMGNYHGDPAYSPESSDIGAWTPRWASFYYSLNGSAVAERTIWNAMISKQSERSVRWDYRWEREDRSDQTSVHLPWPPSLALADALKIVKPNWVITMLVKNAWYTSKAGEVVWEFTAGPTAEGGGDRRVDSVWRVFMNGTAVHAYGPKHGLEQAVTST